MTFRQAVHGNHLLEVSQYWAAKPAAGRGAARTVITDD
jgi:hypothetical protein